MSDKLITSVVTILTAILSVAILAVLVSKKADTSNVLGAAGKAFGGALGVALSPVTGGSGSSTFGQGWGG